MACIQVDSFEHRIGEIIVEAGWSYTNSEGVHKFHTYYTLTQENDPVKYQALLDLGWELKSGKWVKKDNDG